MARKNFSEKKRKSVFVRDKRVCRRSGNTLFFGKSQQGFQEKLENTVSDPALPG